ncbi:hypothetical protein A2673_00810 [Candidatus Kaiserbacteria bacterium RIFCSPHIGHO2_01_FULL_50_13]|uniref:Uncharacterized protein n=1 Tax=Candidatus Kaiserbacteria bacterium RIFCSPLOWO2_01_FULL_50_24 TaxID=1798507 RepID=A0A1F6EMW8_9BACT|nr:MAG: hypothetical protein A2673_00810 [Candidatus Kaiserbacteria bacterium RIFCSPHIGHO2_01_FULL_50_13]OGG74980.1 MAG: hypothetical protein A3A34_04155 [Candidatus Kaiserbacteria bacterium RIFCSPLOWO2_01_FULL_50_24]OGG81783.1 MAG: hypothetical protein A3H74_01230 [Candidatus Kaiserbacteria bacterium RIFCSPLOWO2_02_FULL_51_13]
MEKKKESGLEKLARLIKEESDNIRAIMATKDDLKAFATKEDVRAIVDKAVDDAKDELMAEIRPMARAVDKDAITTVNHEKPILRIEKHLAFK